MPDQSDFSKLSMSDRIDATCDRFEETLRAGEQPRIEDYLADTTEPERSALLRELLALELAYRKQAGEVPTLADYSARFSDDTELLSEVFADSTNPETVNPSLSPYVDTLSMPPQTADTDATYVPGAAPDTSHTVCKRFGDYELLEEIARGGMGVVFRARQTKLNRIVALKMILAGQLASEEEVKRFYSEAEAAAKLDHPGIVPIYEAGQHDGQHFFSMGLVHGQSLAEVVKEGGPFPPKEAAEKVAQISEAVAYAHQQGVIHRDLKPANVLVDGSGQTRVTDFGLAKLVESDSDLTGTGQILGTPSYMPPEQAEGDVSRIGPHSDVYSLGAILYFLLTGRPPFHSDNVMQTLKQVLEREPVSPRQLNDQLENDLETICLKCLQKDAARRYQTASDLSEDIQRYLNRHAVHARPIQPNERMLKSNKRNRIVGSNFQDLVLFKNRDKELQMLWSFLNDNGGKKLLAVVGRSGTGKTALVSRVCQKIESGELTHRQCQPDSRAGGSRLGLDGIVYFDCQGAGKQSVELLYHNLIQLLPSQDRNELRELWRDTVVSDQEKFRTLFLKFQTGVYLLALDNFEETLNDEHTVADESLRIFLRELLTRPHGLRIIVTSSSRVLLESATVAHMQALPLDGGLPTADGIELLRELDASGELGLHTADEETLRTAVEKCYGLPPALYGIYSLLETDLTLELTELIRDDNLFNDQLLSKLAEEQYRRLTNEKARVVEALAIFGKPIGVDAVAKIVSSFSPHVDVHGCLKDLALSHLVTVSRKRQTFELQGILSSYAYTRIPDSGEYNRSACHSIAADYFESMAPQTTSWQTKEDIDPLLESFDQHVKSQQYEAAAQLLDRIDEDYLQRWAHYRTSIAMRERLLRHLTLPELLQSNYGNLALLLRRIGRMHDAVTYLQQAIVAAGDAKLPLASVNWHCELGNTFADLVEIPRAVGEYEVAIKIARESGHTSAEARPLCNLAITYRALGDPTHALKCYEQANAIIDQAISETTDEAERQRFRRQGAISRGNCGNAHLALGNEPQARECFQAAADFMKDDGYRYAAATFSGQLGQCCLHREAYAEAAEQIQKAIEMLQETEEQRSTSYFFEWKGYAHHQLGELSSAKEAYHECLRLNASETNYSCHVLLGILNLELEAAADAQQHLQTGISLCREILQRSPHYYEARYHLALAQLASGQLEESLATYGTAIEQCSAYGIVRGFSLNLDLLARTSRPAAQVEQARKLLAEASHLGMGRIP